MKILRFNLKTALSQYEAKTGLRLTYEELSQLAEISVDTIKSLATRNNYNATLHLISQISRVLNINPIDHFEWVDE